VVVVVNERANGLLKFPREIVVVGHDDVLHGTVPTLDFALCLGMMNGSPHMIDMVAFEIVSQVVEDEHRAVIGQQPGTTPDPDRLNLPDPVAGNVQRLDDVVGSHRVAEPPGDDEARLIIQDGVWIVPAPTHHLELRKIGLPQLTGARVLCSNSSPAVTIWKAGLVTRSWALRIRYTLDSEMKYAPGRRYAS
jgi:hypothetical protein